MVFSVVVDAPAVKLTPVVYVFAPDAVLTPVYVSVLFPTKVVTVFLNWSIARILAILN